MKYAFILGSNAYIASRGSISFFENGEEKEFLKIQSVFKSVKAGNTELSVDIQIADAAGNPVSLPASQNNSKMSIEYLPERVKIINADGSTLIDVHQLDHDVYMHLSHHITAELERYDPIAVIRLFGHFMVGNHNISIDNEKLFIDDDSFAESVLIGPSGVQFRTDGVSV